MNSLREYPESPGQPKAPELRRVYWREEILEVVLWLRGEGFDDRIDAPLLRRFLGMSSEQASEYLRQLTEQGYFFRLRDGRYGLTVRGEAETRRLLIGRRSIPPPASGPCGPACWCHASPLESASCLSEQVG